jgi:hypothetical protein
MVGPTRSSPNGFGASGSDDLPPPPPMTPSEAFMATLSYGHPWAHYSGGYQDQLLGGPLGLPDLCCKTPNGVGCKGYGGGVLV